MTVKMEEQDSPRYSIISRAPPRYSTVFNTADSSGPRYETFSLKNSKGKAWASLNLQKESSSRRTGATSAPVFVEDTNPIVGSVTLDLESSETIQSVTIAVRGNAITGANEGGTNTFLDHSVILWSKDQGDPYIYRTGSTTSSTSPTSPRGGTKFIGAYAFPFSISLPPPNSNFGNSTTQDAAWKLPESFVEKSSVVQVRYEIVLKIGRGRLRADYKLQIPIVYRRRTFPPAPSELRHLSYQENTPPPGPVVDPYGWILLSSVDCVGRFLNSRTVVLRCTLSLASPLSYTRGSFIPCHLRIESIDSQALDFLASSRTSIVRLSRSIKYLYDAGQGMQQNRKSMASRPKYDVKDVGQAVWWHDSSIEDSRVRCLMGEIHLSKDLSPSSGVIPFSVEYTVSLLPFESPTFIPNEETPVQMQKVEIVTEYAPGPPPIARTNQGDLPAGWAPSTSDTGAAIDAPHSNPFRVVGT